MSFVICSEPQKIGSPHGHHGEGSESVVESRISKNMDSNGEPSGKGSETAVESRISKNMDRNGENGNPSGKSSEHAVESTISENMDRSRFVENEWNQMDFSSSALTSLLKNPKTKDNEPKK